MKKLLSIAAVSLVMQQGAAQPATFVNDTLTIPHAALIDESAPAYYSNVQLSNNGDGTLSVVAGEQQNLVNVDSVDVLIMESFPVQVSLAVSGNKSVPCVDLLPAAVSRVENGLSLIHI